MTSSIENYIVLAVGTAILAFLAAVAGYPTLSWLAVVAGVVAGLTSILAAFTDTTHVGGVVPVKTVAVWIAGGIVAAIGFLSGQTILETSSVLAAIGIFAATLVQEVESSPSTTPPVSTS